MVLFYCTTLCPDCKASLRFQPAVPPQADGCRQFFSVVHPVIAAQGQNIFILHSIRLCRGCQKPLHCDLFCQFYSSIDHGNCRLPTVSRTRQPFRVRSISTRAGVHRSFCAVFTAISAAGSVRSASSVQAVLGFMRRSATSSTVCTPRRASWFSTAFWAEAPPRNSTIAVSFWVTTTAGALALPTRSMCTTSRLRALPSPMETAAASRMHGPATRSRTRQ